VLAAKHLLRLSRVDLLFEGVEGLGQIAGHILAALRPFEQDTDVVDLLGEAVAKLNVFGETSLPL
jgi:hypothetical protein